MATVDENAVLILKVMRQNGFTSSNRVSTEKLAELTHLGNGEFKQADAYLREAQFISGTVTFCGRGERYITQLGIEYVKTEVISIPQRIRKGMPAFFLSLVAIVGCVAAVVVVPEIRAFLGLDAQISLPTENVPSTLIPIHTSIPTITSSPFVEATIDVLTTPAATPQELRYGIGLIQGVDYREGGTNYGYSFEQGKSSSNEIPADVSFENCGVNLDSRLTCHVRAASVWNIGSMPLNEIITPNWIRGCGGENCTIANGQSFVIETYSGHLAKFRISNLNLDRVKRTFEISIEWVYQPNNRDDFRTE